MTLTKHLLAATWASAVFGLFGAPLALVAEPAVVLPAPAVDAPLAGQAGTAEAVFAGGCFWGVQGVFQHVDGVVAAVSGYAGGNAATASYTAVSSGSTRHAEAVRITYDSSRITYGKLLQIFFSVAHDPTQLNRQGPDHGPQYRSAIFPSSEEQRAIAERYIEQLMKAAVFAKPIVTVLEDAPEFYAAEPYHQDFVFRNPSYPYVVVNDQPKIANLRKVFAELFRDEPALVLQRSGRAHGAVPPRNETR